METFDLQKRRLTSLEINAIYSLKLDNQTQSKLMLFFSLSNKPRTEVFSLAWAVRLTPVMLFITAIIMLRYLSVSSDAHMITSVIMNSTVPIVATYMPLLALGVITTELQTGGENPGTILSSATLLFCGEIQPWERYFRIATSIVLSCALICAQQYSLIIVHGFYLFVLYLRREKIKVLFTKHLEKLGKAKNVYEYYSANIKQHSK